MTVQPLVSTFCLPLDFSRLQNDRVKLVPFESNHERFANEHMKASEDSPQVYDYLGYGPFQDVDDVTAFWNASMANPGTQYLAIILKARYMMLRSPTTGETQWTDLGDDTVAGFISLLNTSLANSVTEIGHILILPRFQRTFVNSTAVCLLLHHCLNPQPYDLNLRRVEWRCNSLNEPSKAAARRFAFKEEGTFRWFVALPHGKRGHKDDRLPTKDARGNELGPGRHTTVFAICWDDWLNGVREHVSGLLSR